MLRIVTALIAMFLLTGCPERPDADLATKACENLLFIADQTRASNETASFKPVSADEQRKAALDAFVKTLGEERLAVMRFFHAQKCRARCRGHCRFGCSQHCLPHDPANQRAKWSKTWSGSCGQQA